MVVAGRLLLMNHRPLFLGLPHDLWVRGHDCPPTCAQLCVPPAVSPQLMCLVCPARLVPARTLSDVGGCGRALRFELRA